MHKSLGNGVDPAEVFNKYGADLLRLWAGSSDYHVDVRCSDEIFKQLSQNYLKFRNTCKFCLDNLVGFDVEVAKLIAYYIGVDVQYSETVWSSIFASLDAGKIDMVVNEVSYSEERAEKYDFSTPYTYSQKAILVPADNTDINSLADIAGKIAANDATSSIGQLALDSGATLDPVGEMAQSISEVLSGRADLTLNNTVAFTDYLKQHPESEDKVRIIVATDPAPSGYIPVMKGNDKLLAAINEALDKAREDGTLSELSLKYFGVDITKEADDAEATQTPAE